LFLIWKIHTKRLVSTGAKHVFDLFLEAIIIHFSLQKNEETTMLGYGVAD